MSSYWKDNSVLFKDGDVIWMTAPVSSGMVTFDFVPAIGVKESLEWVTDILKPKDGIGSEQRISTRPIPRQSFTYTIFLHTEEEQSRFEAMMFGWQKRYFALPILTEKVLHTGTITAEDRTITIDTTKGDFREGGYVEIWKSSTANELLRISTVAANLLTLETPVVTTYTGDKFIIPHRITQVSSVVKRRNSEVPFSQIQITFIVKDNVLLSGYTAVQEYLGLPIITTGSFIGQRDKEYSSESDSFLQDYNTGDFDYLSDSEFNIIGQNHTFYNQTQEACWNFRLFLHSLVGRQGTFWLPTYRNDLTPTEAISAVETDINIQNIKLADNMGVNSLRTNLAFILPDGTIICRAITNIVEVDDDEETITIDSALGVEVAMGGCTISFLDLCRQASDVVDIEWTEPNKNLVNQVLLAVKE